VSELADALAALRRRRQPALWALTGVLSAALLAALLWPPTYRSTGTILIEQQELPSELVQSTISSYADQRIQVISQRVMTTDNLLRIIQRYDLYARLRQREPREVLLERMRSDVNFQMISAEVMDPRQGRATKANIAFAISYDNRSPEVAARVANELVSLYLDENLRTRRQLATDAESFLDAEANKLNVSINQRQAEIAQFKAKHLGTLPDQNLLNDQFLTRTEEELRDVDTQLRSYDQQASYLDAQLAQISPSSQVYTSTGERVLSPADRLKFLRTEYARISAIYSPTHPDVVRTRREIEGLEHTIGTVDSSNDVQRQLDDARSKLAAAEQRYAPDHPDVVRLKREVTSLGEAVNPPAGQPATPSLNPDNPAYIQVKGQIEATSAARASLLQKRSQLQTRIAGIEGRLALSPGVERDYTAMTRELDADQFRYREVREKQMSAKLAENLETEKKGERFTLIDPPLTPEKPASPNRWLIASLGLVLALAAGLGTVLTLESFDQSVRNRRDLQSLLQVPPLAIVPRILNSDDLQQQRRSRQQALAGVLGLAVLTLMLTHFFFRPLDVLWEVALRKLGG
jgi:polysaccharide biosynthesis transport protein